MKKTMELYDPLLLQILYEIETNYFNIMYLYSYRLKILSDVQ